MSFETDLIDQLETVLGNSMIYPLKAAEGASLPYVVFDFITDEWEESLNEANDSVTSELELQIYADTYLEAYNLSESIKFGLKDFTSDDVLSLLLDNAADSFLEKHNNITCTISQVWLINHLL